MFTCRIRSVSSHVTEASSNTRACTCIVPIPVSVLVLATVTAAFMNVSRTAVPVAVPVSAPVPAPAAAARRPSFSALLDSSDAELAAHFAAWPLHERIPFNQVYNGRRHRDHTLLTEACSRGRPARVKSILDTAEHRRQLRRQQMQDAG